MIALLDGDIITYRVGFTTMETEPYIALARTDETIRTICQAIGTQEYKVFLTPQGQSNYRYSIAETYKANRKNALKPTHYTAIREYLCDTHGAEVAQGEEADDRLGIEQTKRGDNSIICSIDKDLNQIKGWHFNFVKGLRFYVSEHGGIKWFWSQMLIGDTSDNIFGIRGLGEKRVAKLFHELSDEVSDVEYYKIVAKEYKKQHGDKWLDELTKNGQLLWIRREENQMWTPPDIEVD